MVDHLELLLNLFYSILTETILLILKDNQTKKTNSVAIVKAYT